MKSAPEELTACAALITTPDGHPAVALVPCYCGVPVEGGRVMKPLREFRSPLTEARRLGLAAIQVATGMKKISYNGYRLQPRSFIRRSGSIFGSPRAPATSRTLLAERGIAVTYETVRRWGNHFAPLTAADLRRRRPKPHAGWHLDEVYLKIDGRMVYLWRAADAEGEVLDVLIQVRRDKHAALKLMRKLLKKYGSVPRALITDYLRSYSSTAHDLGIEHRHERGRW
jgi:putative transposase